MKKKKRANGEGSIYYNRQTKKWVGQITVGRYENGKQKRKTVYGNSKSEVIQKLKQIEFQIYTGDFVDKSSITVYQLAKQLFDDDLNSNEIKENTYFRNMETLKRLKSIYNTPLQKVHEAQIKNYLLNEQNYSQSTINKVYGLLKRTLSEAVRRNIIAKNPMDGMKRPKSKQVKTKIRALTVEEEKKLFDVLMNSGEEFKYSRQMLLSMFTGMRMGEINALRVTDINIPFKQICVNGTISRGEKGEAILTETTKTEAGARSLPIAPNVKDLILGCIRFKKDGLIFQTSKGGLITTSQVNLEFRRILKKYNIVDETIYGNVTLHSLRHTYATRCIEAGVQPKVLQTLLGHTDITVTLNTYCDAFDNFRDENLEKANAYFEQMGLNVNYNNDNSIVCFG